MEQESSGTEGSGAESMTDALARVGIVVTTEGRARARRLLDDAKARRDPAKLQAVREQLGFTTQPAS